jgi:hypothetical protein
MAVPSISIQTSTGDRLNADTENLTWAAATRPMIPAWCFAWERRTDLRFDIYNGRLPALLPGDCVVLVGLLTRTTGHPYRSGESDYEKDDILCRRDYCGSLLLPRAA